jgi:hypothetical protein
MYSTRIGTLDRIAKASGAKRMGQRIFGLTFPQRRRQNRTWTCQEKAEQNLYDVGKDACTIP